MVGQCDIYRKLYLFMHRNCIFVLDPVLHIKFVLCVFIVVMMFIPLSWSSHF